ncbi:hypothetical protein GA0116948_11473 [Chitinophaga costaii]|uniref:Uncharacterized protein n=1 Tax=Chitinophaga costaii TaxID=1335309 RepID=A0A1C4FI01_9BACT|nr:hypothetical protein [Chitinophaga costaii]PUZ20288.1 hypothetical protein DCM91_19145 [Chitinophaga costaii]SCC55472.1 hypothetical protein GA0116948_11473 [Chitinophaga costaii]
MKSFSHFILVMVLSYFAGVFLPVWWGFAVAVFLVTLILPLRPGSSFLGAFAGVFLLWLLLTFIADIRNDHILGNRMSQLIFKLNAPWLLGLVTALIGGLIAGFAAMAAAYLRFPQKVKRVPYAS